MKSIPYLACSFLVILAAACAGEPPESETGLSESETAEFSLTKHLGSALEDANSAITNFSTKKLGNPPSEEVEKLFRYEYLVKDMPLNLSDKEMEENFQSLGRDRWDCFHMEHVTRGSIRIFCKRRPKSYLQYMKVF